MKWIDNIKRTMIILRNIVDAANNRISTLVMYLNDVEEGGETFFPKLNLSVHLEREWQYTLSISIKTNH